MKKINYSVFENIRNAIFVLMGKLCWNDLQDLNFTLERYIYIFVKKDLQKLKKAPIWMPKRLLIHIAGQLSEQYAELSDNKEVKRQKQQMENYTDLVRRQNILVTCYKLLSIESDNKTVLKFLSDSRIKGDDIMARLDNEIKTLNLRIEEQKQVVMVKDTTKGKSIEIGDYMSLISAHNQAGFKSDIKMSMLLFIKTNTQYIAKIESEKEHLENLKNRR
jgi:hypothetical protein